MSTRNLILKCDFSGCHKIYSTKYNLKRHVETAHCKLKRFKCRLCGKNLSSKQNLNEHIFTHSDSKPFACPDKGCGQVFRQRSQLSNHRKMHRELLVLAQQMKKVSTIKVKHIQLTTLLEKSPLNPKSEELHTVVNDYPILPQITEYKYQVKLPLLGFN